jgi:hypothetical protein
MYLKIYQILLFLFFYLCHSFFIFLLILILLCMRSDLTSSPSWNKSLYKLPVVAMFLICYKDRVKFNVRYILPSTNFLCSSSVHLPSTILDAYMCEILLETTGVVPLSVCCLYILAY